MLASLQRLNHSPSPHPAHAPWPTAQPSLVHHHTSFPLMALHCTESADHSPLPSFAHSRQSLPPHPHFQIIVDGRCFFVSHDRRRLLTRQSLMCLATPVSAHRHVMTGRMEGGEKVKNGLHLRVLVELRIEKGVGAYTFIFLRDSS